MARLKLSPYSPLARLVTAPLWLKSLFAIALLFLLCAYPLSDIVRLQQQLHDTALGSADLQHQQRQKQQIVALLTHKAEQINTQLAPQTAAKIATLNQRLQSAVASFSALNIEQQHWQFSRSPLLQLELQGSFYDISHFVADLQQQFTELKLLNLTLQHTEQQPATQAILNLLFSEDRIDKEIADD
ncbi:hypothetical protein FHQ26_07860 [Testudinibacter sp. TR-2022]|uniref:hypothetical protein n=1 Tax=Testudinibacter sp. TR-2022 TaxID=2585029 RepID=UPI0011192652|nr:hypothetical protein [Testudinibacter sp. TR-2022]TNH04027.1 hypothetical protein FHQ22_06100 [Pasteurellaceae bacterium Phil31]TNH08785.1 hypothetical protein FHQ26_07860 [Testudinibacter sp. TR-2022]TNH11461.1 hypothetical protein FHQ25_02735 [Testudinibacter sp. TR-2022]